MHAQIADTCGRTLQPAPPGFAQISFCPEIINIIVLVMTVLLNYGCFHLFLNLSFNSVYVTQSQSRPGSPNYGELFIKTALYADLSVPRAAPGPI